MSTEVTDVIYLVVYQQKIDFLEQIFEKVD